MCYQDFPSRAVFFFFHRILFHLTHRKILNYQQSFTNPFDWRQRTVLSIALLPMYLSGIKRKAFFLRSRSLKLFPFKAALCLVSSRWEINVRETSEKNTGYIRALRKFAISYNEKSCFCALMVEIKSYNLQHGIYKSTSAKVTVVGEAQVFRETRSTKLATVISKTSWFSIVYDAFYIYQIFFTVIEILTRNNSSV